MKCNFVYRYYVKKYVVNIYEKFTYQNYYEKRKNGRLKIEKIDFENCFLIFLNFVYSTQYIFFLIVTFFVTLSVSILIVLKFKLRNTQTYSIFICEYIIHSRSRIKKSEYKWSLLISFSI